MPPPPASALVDRLLGFPSVALGTYPTPIEELANLRHALDAAPRLLIKRDDAISFAFGGNKVRKLELVLAAALRDGADTLITMGSVQSNHARVTASAAARLGLDCHLVLSGTPPERPTANALLDALAGAHVHYVASPHDREATMGATANALRALGRKVYEIPLGASIPLGALGYARAIGELLAQAPPPDVIVHSSSSGGTQAGLLAGCALFGAPTRVIGVSADEPAPTLSTRIESILRGLETMLDTPPGSLALAQPIDVDDRFVGAGYGLPTTASVQSLERLARTEAVFLDPTYTAKAMAALIEYLGAGRFERHHTVLFWHTGGQVALFA